MQQEWKKNYKTHKQRQHWTQQHDLSGVYDGVKSVFTLAFLKTQFNAILTFLLAPKEILASAWKIVWEPRSSYCNSRLWQAAMSARSKTSCGVCALKIQYSTSLMCVCVHMCECECMSNKVFTVLIGCFHCGYASVCCSYAQCASGQNAHAFSFFGCCSTIVCQYNIWMYKLMISMLLYEFHICSIKHSLGICEAEFIKFAYQ